MPALERAAVGWLETENQSNSCTTIEGNMETSQWGNPPADVVIGGYNEDGIKAVLGPSCPYFDGYFCWSGKKTDKE